MSKYFYKVTEIVHSPIAEKKERSFYVETTEKVLEMAERAANDARISEFRFQRMWFKSK